METFTIPTKDYKRHQVHELPRVKAIVTEYQLYFGKCCICGEAHQAPLPPGVPAGMLAPYAMSAIVTLTGDYRLSKRNVAALFYDFYGLRVSIGTVSNVEKIVSASLEKHVEEAKNFIPQQSVVHGDETSHAEKGQKMWTWVFIAAQVAAFIICFSRDSEYGSLVRLYLARRYFQAAVLGSLKKGLYKNRGTKGTIQQNRKRPVGSYAENVSKLA